MLGTVLQIWSNSSCQQNRTVGAHGTGNFKSLFTELGNTYKMNKAALSTMWTVIKQPFHQEIEGNEKWLVNTMLYFFLLLNFCLLHRMVVFFRG